MSKPKDSELVVSKPNDIKEKFYITRQVQTSITLLDALETEVVLEALLFLSKYADLQPTNLHVLQLHGLLGKLLKLLSRNICILRLSLRMLNILLSIEDTFFELDQEQYDENITEISNLFVVSDDIYVKEYCLEILTKIAASCRIALLIFKIDLLHPIIHIIKTSDNPEHIQTTLNLFYILLDAPGAVSQLPDVEIFHPAIFLNHLNHENKEIAQMSLEIIRKLTYFGVATLQKSFREIKLVEKMLVLLMNPDLQGSHKKIVSILYNCLNSEETVSYFVESVEFLDFCQWAKTCDPDYLLPCVTIIEKLTKIPELRQMLFDLSVEDCILLFLRSTEKIILNKTCGAISNMSNHKYCCDRMITPVVIRELLAILRRNDPVEDKNNEVALKTIFNLTRRHYKTLDLLFNYEGPQVLLGYLGKGMDLLSEESYMQLLELLNQFVAHSEYQKKMVSPSFFQTILKLFQSTSKDLSLISLEIMTNCIPLKEFRTFLLSSHEPIVTIQVLETTKNMTLFKNILVFIHGLLMYKNMVKPFLYQGLFIAFKRIPENVTQRAPLIERIKNIMYNIYLPIKFYETNRLAITDKLADRFYIINGPWQQNFPFLELLEMLKVSTFYTIYVVDFTYEPSSEIYDFLVKSKCVFSLGSSNSLSDDVSADSIAFPCAVYYGKLSPDPFLPKYITHIQKYFAEPSCMTYKIKWLAEYIDSLLCGPKEEQSLPQKIHTFKYHVQCLKNKLGTNMIPIGYLRIGFHCERALLFKAIADRTGIPATFVKGRSKLYWNEIVLVETADVTGGRLRTFVVDLMFNIGNLMPLGSKAANSYCNIKVDDGEI